MAADVAMAALYMATGRVEDADSFLQRAQRLDDMGTLSSQETLLALVQEFRAGLQDAPEEDTPREDRRRQDTRDEDSPCTLPVGPHHGVEQPGDASHARDAAARQGVAGGAAMQLPSHAPRPAAPAGRSTGSLSAPQFGLQAAPNPVLVCPELSCCILQWFDW